jgi:thioesterase domain-containing protein/acyl carrier protein
MVPSWLVFVASLPLLPNGKLDRRALAQLAATAQLPQAEGSAPRTALEAELARLWEDLLGVRPVGIHSDFFDLGGHSLLAVRLLVRIRQQFGREISLAALFGGATIERLAGLLEEKEGAAESPVVILQPEGSRAPFVCVHPIGGGVLVYGALARLLGSDQPFYALQAFGLGGGRRVPQATIEGMAEAYLSALRRVQPMGPYRLGGWSYGGVVAFEMARQLEAAGEEVALLALIDTLAPSDSSEEAILDDSAVGLGLAREEARQLGKEWALTLADLNGLSGDARLLRVLAELQRVGIVGPEIELPDLSGFLDDYKARMSMLMRYRPGMYAGKVTLFRAREIDDEERAQILATQEVSLADPALGWERVASGGVEVRLVGGHHATVVLEPHVRELAEALRVCLDPAAEPLVTSPQEEV